METIQNNQFAIIHNSIEVLKTGPEILQNNQDRKEKALQVGKNILCAIQEQGMSPELDERAMKYLANVNAANKEMKDSRAAVTQIMDSLKKMYTEVENELDVKKDGTVPSQIQLHRNQYAKELAEENERRRKQAELEAAKKKEAIDLKYAAEKGLIDGFTSYLSEKKQKISSAFNSCTIDTLADFEAKMNNYKPNYPQDAHQAVSIRTSQIYHSAAEVEEIYNLVRSEKYQSFKDSYELQMEEFKNSIIEKIPAKLSELEEQKRLADEEEMHRLMARIAEEERQASIAMANAEEKAKLEAEAKKQREHEAKQQEELKRKQEAAIAEQKRREEEEAARMAAEAEEKRKQAEQEAELKKQGEQTMAMFEKEAAIAEAVQAPEVRQGYEITVLHPVGFTQIFAFWFEKVGKDLPVDKIGNTKLDQMKAWAEKAAHKDGTMIESKFLKYEPTYSAVNKKAK